jgi:hypothetical protein
MAYDWTSLVVKYCHILGLGVRMLILDLYISLQSRLLSYLLYFILKLLAFEWIGRVQETGTLVELFSMNNIYSKAILILVIYYRVVFLNSKTLLVVFQKTIMVISRPIETAVIRKVSNEKLRSLLEGR